jgi:5-deoxy-5-amino-3-dehydroquinate synthase
MSRQQVTVQLGERSYPVIVGAGVRAELNSVLPTTARRAVIVTQQSIPIQVETDIPSTTVVIGDGEQSKSLATIEHVVRAFAAAGLNRNDVVIGVGGGLVTDVAGFAAASWHRGTPVVHVSTSLVGMVDAAIGGKTGVNLPEGKNLVGAFWQPHAVLCDTDALSTLPERELRCGYGEMAKYHFLTGDDLLAMDLTSRIARCVQIKADIVASDEREGGLRAVLNYGHTLGHALEISTGFTIAHGEAVAVGMIFAAHLAQVLGRIDEERVAYHQQVVSGAYGLSTALPQDSRAEDLVALMMADKKALHGLTFVLDGANGVEVVADVATTAVTQALSRMEVR